MADQVDLARVLATFEEPWTPRTVATLNDYDVRVVKTKGEFTRHSHPDTDELFLVLRGSLTIRMDVAEVQLGPGTAVRRAAGRAPSAGVRPRLPRCCS